jgi:hypothetical protein
MALQTFTASQVLTAAQMNTLQANDYNQTVSTKTSSYVLVAADKGTTIVMNSASATTITVNTSLFTAGDTLRIQNIGAGACVVTAGTATVTSAGLLSIPQWGGGTLYFTTAAAAVYFPNATTAGGLTLIKAQTIGTTVGSVTVTGAFSSTYDNYLITVNGGVASTTNGAGLTLGATATGYYRAGNYTTFTATTVAGVQAANAASWADVLYGNTSSLYGTIYLYSPNLAKLTFFTASMIYGDTGGLNLTQGGMLNNTTQYTDFTFTATTGTWTTWPAPSSSILCCTRVRCMQNR